MKTIKQWGLALAGAAALGLPSVSSAAMLDVNSGNPLDFSWSYNTGSSLLTGNGSILATKYTDSVLALTVSLANTSANTGQGGDRLTGFAFGIEPDAYLMAFSDNSDGGMVAAWWASGTMAANVPGVEVCAYGGNNCSGGSNGGIFAGMTDTFTVWLGGLWGNSVNIDPIGLRYQTGNGSYTFASTNPGALPEPATASLIGLGLGMLGMAAARRRKQDA